MKLPPVVSAQQWERAREALPVAEQALTPARDALAAERRRTPGTAVEREYALEGPRGRLVLASRSPQRRAILEQVGIAYEALPVDVAELAAGDPIEVARANALAKARAGAQRRPGALVVGVDTLVALDGEIFGKPPSAAAARAVLERLSGRTHAVVSGLAVVSAGNPQVVHEVTEVTFRELHELLLERYVASGEWSGRAGGYAIQGRGAVLVTRIMGDYLNVVGLPLAKMLDLDLSLILSQS